MSEDTKTREQMWQDPSWTCPRCKSINAGHREKCRICGLDSAQMSEGHYFGKHTEIKQDG